ncbi:hypothetical protein A3F07_01080 [candidate division WWE3 bacterium RIFCSPHIGHO2_12_FULL_38_15]|uniref:Uncharacterized protein n=1 Tax=candidate division WWE3 bacterium RIFCSPHIGHO2_02_FULL_38_14 TaxID=1802620 RepID=A0A1F4VA37_UNCKA|nr:MAG: hypothetical protein A2793_03720 [candidate division WWE3 bacterium RIFCSPHIGHO2_01_FULL_38_45]OGC49168.1 MAG: hypothetical protein A3F07_01080 [candidate division WWE3 bacterium RIFCSPHIGHO2_12_FULL_38_15]OGC52566.1 MAG: hypothetical protein A3B64_03325 [candidate division WWE3 bacterium RIFCSPLOWO2_01_FULL_37_24]OGC54057.1 MAG: hypothetical protein A3D91_04850 [candidate division WWE3 bacterium RIFCSPHIGHO2_02_FULL_38_14]HLB51771.1 hypothetical protein [Patescibacteria group bacterium
MCFEFGSSEFIDSLSDAVEAENEEEAEKRKILERIEALEKRWHAENLERRHRNRGTVNNPTGHEEGDSTKTERYSGELKKTSNVKRRRKDVELINEGLGDYIVEKAEMDRIKMNKEVEDESTKQSKTKILPKSSQEIANTKKTDKIGEGHPPKLHTKDSDDLPDWMFRRDPTRRFK